VDCSPTNNGRRRPLQGVNNQYLQLPTRRWGPPEYGEIRARGANHGWGNTGGDSLGHAVHLALPQKG
jgi:hypothetical protein